MTGVLTPLMIEKRLRILDQQSQRSYWRGELADNIVMGDYDGLGWEVPYMAAAKHSPPVRATQQVSSSKLVLIVLSLTESQEYSCLELERAVSGGFVDCIEQAVHASASTLKQLGPAHESQ